jgi:hypothetical protein
MKEKCECESNQQESRLKISIKRQGKDLEVTVHGRANHSETVSPNSTCSLVFGRSHSELAKLGEGQHDICHCKTIGPKGAIGKTKK